MVSEQFHCLILISVIHHWSVIAGKNNHGIFSQSCFLQRFEKFTNHRICFQNSIPSGAHPTSACKSGVRSSGYMGLLETIVKEKWFIGFLQNKLACFIQKIIGHINVGPTGFMTSFHVSDPGYPVYNGLVMTM